MRQFVRARFLALVVIISAAALVAAACSGAEGPAGPQGPSGADGTRGEVGPQGIPGPSGSQGAPGSSGSSGVRGPAGAAGADGKTIVSPANVIAGSTLFDYPIHIAVSGGAIRVWGSGFNAGESVLIKVGDTSVPGGSAEANSEGAFAITTDALPSSVGPGIYSLWAVGDGGTMVSSPLTVVDKIK